MKPTILIENDVYRKVMYWVNKSQYEVSGLGLVKVEKDGVLRVTSAILLPQKNGSAHTDIEAEDVNKALFQLRESEGDLRWWWHSHVKMPVFWSGTDHDTIKKVGEGGWFAATVFNQNKEVKSCYYGSQGTQTPWGSEPLFIDDLSTKLTDLDIDDTKAWDEEYEKNVVTTYQAPVVVYGGKYQGMKTGVQSGTSGGTATKWNYEPHEKPPEKRPENMPKRVYKSWKKAYSEYILDVQADAFDLRKEVGFGVDEYGFDQQERALLAGEGWTSEDVDNLIEDFTPSEMLRMAKLRAKPKEVDYLLKQFNYSAEDVMALADQSESFGANLFDGLENFREATQ